MNKELKRKVYKQIRNSVSETEKTEWDKRILTRFVNTELYMNADILLIYVSIGSEVDTKCIIEHALKDKKRVAVPVCINKEMSFYVISGLSDLIIGKFGIPTVEIGNNLKVNDLKNALCVVPAVCFDVYGNRIGYGGGYYDRFLSRNRVTTVGLSYERCVCRKITSEHFDVTIDYILTENKMRNSKLKGGFYI